MSVTFQYVDQIASSPTVRLDINDGTIFDTLLDQLDLSPPTLSRSVADTILTDGALIPASAYDNRVLKFRLHITGTSADDLATKIRSLMVELNRQQNIIKYQPGSTALFFRTFRSPDVTVDDTLKQKFQAMVTCQVEAEPFAYGLRVDSGATTVKADPSQTNGCYVDVNSVTGDVETPALISLSSGTVTSASPSYFAVRRRGTPSSLVFVYQSEAGTSDVGDTTVAGSNDANASGAGNNYMQTTFASGTGQLNRYLVTFAGGTELRGTYRVLIRVAKTVGTDVITVGNDFNSTIVTFSTNSTAYRWLDMGLLQLPPNADAMYNGYSGAEYTMASGATGINFSAGRTSGTGNLRWDVALLLPADESLAVLSTNVWSTASTNTAVLDGPNDTQYLTTGGNFASASGMSRVGSYPLLRAGNNRIFIVENTTTAVVGSTSSVVVSYWPRYLIV